MIKNEREYRISRTRAAKIEKELEDLLQQSASRATPTNMERSQTKVLCSQVSELRSKLAEYEALKSGKVKRFGARTFDDLPAVLIQARIANGMSQKDLASQMGVKEQQVQRYEATNYATASFGRVKSIIRILGLTIHEEISLIGPRS